MLVGKKLRLHPLLNRASFSSLNIFFTLALHLLLSMSRKQYPVKSFHFSTRIGAFCMNYFIFLLEWLEPKLLYTTVK